MMIHEPARIRVFWLEFALLFSVVGICRSFLLSHKETVPCPRATWFASPVNTGWYPRTVEIDDIFNPQDDTSLEEDSVSLAAELVKERLQRVQQSKGDDSVGVEITPHEESLESLISGRFMDLTCSLEGEIALENLFWDSPSLLEEADSEVIRGAVWLLQSLCIMGSQVGLKGPPEQLRRLVAHLETRKDAEDDGENDLLHSPWNRDSVRQLKFESDRTPAFALLAKLLWKRTPQGAFDLLVQLGAWEFHEDLALLRSGFPLRFTAEEETAAKEAEKCDHDPDSLLGIRQDFRHMKVFTIDGPSTTDIDDGLSIEKVMRKNTEGADEEKYRIWIHIADADRWAPRDSTLFEVARQRITSLYLPTGPITMFPKSVTEGLMSLQACTDSYAMSLGVELNHDGSVDKNSLVITPSIIQVTYRLTYDDVDEMLEEGIGYQEEWELGALLGESLKRRNYRIARGSTEGIVLNPIPYATLSTKERKGAIDGIDIELSVQVAYNSGKNQSSTLEQLTAPTSSMEEPVSSSYLLVTEAMIMAGEAIGHWKAEMDDQMAKESSTEHENSLRLAFRSQPQPDFKGRARERKVLMDLAEYNVGDGYCQAWYSRRFLQAARVSENPFPHSGLGLECYVHWSSPIRRFGDLQVHSSVKRFLRRKKVFEMLRDGTSIPMGVREIDLGIPDGILDLEKRVPAKTIVCSMLDEDINYREGGGLFGASRQVQRQSQQYWLFEYIRRLREEDPDQLYEAVILGCTNPERGQYAIYVYKFGLEHRFLAPGGRLDAGLKVQLRIDNVSPRNGILHFVRAH